MRYNPGVVGDQVAGVGGFGGGHQRGWDWGLGGGGGDQGVERWCQGAVVVVPLMQAVGGFGRGGRLRAKSSLHTQETPEARRLLPLLHQPGSLLAVLQVEAAGKLHGAADLTPQSPPSLSQSPTLQ